LKQYAKTLLFPFYDGLEQFFKDIFSMQDEYNYVVFVAQRCSNLAELFYYLIQNQSLLGERPQDYPPNFITDSALLSQADAMVSVYKRDGCFPTILIVDDIVIYGRSLSALLEMLEKRILERLEPEGYDCDEVISALLRAVRLRAFARNNQSLLLTSRYQPNFEAMEKMAPKRWRDLSNRITRLVQTVGLVNSSFISGAELDLSLTQWNDLCMKGFSRVDTNYDSFSECMFYRTVTLENAIQAIYTVRLFWTSSYGSSDVPQQKVVVVPFVFLPDISEDIMERVIAKALGQLRTQLGDTPLDAGGKWQNSGRTRVEAFTLLLSISLLKEFCRMTGYTAKPNGQIKLRMNYAAGLDQQVEQFIRNVLDMGKPLLSLAQMDDLFLNCADFTSVEPLGYAVWEEPRRVTGSKEFKNYIEDIIYRIGLKYYKRSYIETKVYHEPGLAKGEVTSDYFVSLSTLLKKLTGNVKGKGVSAELVAWILQFLDAGILSLGVRTRAQETGNSVLQCVKTGEQSQFIMPKRLCEFIPVLILIQRKAYALDRTFEFELARLAQINRDCRERKGDILEFVQRLESSGQDLEDWDFNLLAMPSSNSGTWKEEIKSALEMIQRQQRYVSDYMDLVQPYER